jgi:hypothetical protein
MKKKAQSEIIREIAIRNVLIDENLTNILHKAADYLENIQNIKTVFKNSNLDESIFEETYSEKSKISALIAILDIITNLYVSDLSEQEYAYANDLYDKVAVGYFKDSYVADSSFAEDLRENNYFIDFKSAEISLQARIIRLLEDVMPKGYWIVE